MQYLPTVRDDRRIIASARLSGIGLWSATADFTLKATLRDEAKGAQLVPIGERFDTTSPMGIAMFQVAGVFAQLERAMIRARQREGIEAA
jgi:hypothetical protein